MAIRTDELTRSRGNKPAHEADPLRDTNDPELIRKQIAYTRGQMGQTIEQIQTRLSPTRLKEQTKEAIREGTIGKVEQMTNRAEYEARNLRAKITHTIKENPIPAALIGIGLGWMALSDDGYGRSPYQGEAYTYYPESTPYRRDREESNVRHLTEEGRERAAEAVDNVRHRVNDAAESVQERASAAQRQARQSAHEAREQVSETAADLQYRARQGLRQTKRTTQQTFQENPLAVGAAALAFGALIGLAMPSTPTEDRWMGERSDEVKEEARQRVQQRAEEVKTVANEARDAAVETAKTEAEKQGLRKPTTSGTETTRSHA